MGLKADSGPTEKMRLDSSLSYVHHNSIYIKRIRTNLDTQGEDWVNNFVDPCNGILHGQKYC